MSYFRTESEALHLALSRDGLAWQPLNNNRPVWHATIGNKSVRDPFILRDQTGTFRLFSTNSWQSDSILIADSTDLVEWKNPRLAPVMSGVPDTCNCWAPECFYDPEVGVYRVLFSSAQHPEGVTEWDHRIWTCSTHDFETWSAPELFFDPGYSVIDASVVRLGPTRWMMAWKDERGSNAAGNLFKRIKVSFAPSSLGPWEEESSFLTLDYSEGPTLFRREGGWTMFYDAFIDHYFGALHTNDEGRTWQDISKQIAFPPEPRHASVLEISSEEAEKLKAHWQTNKSST